MAITSTISLGYLVMLKTGLLKDGESFKVGRAHLKGGDVLRCVSCEGDVRQFVSRRTGAAFAFSMQTLAAKFNAIGFDGLEEISA